jgi:general secretion pathway protein L
MTTTLISGAAAKTSRWGRALWKILSFSLADDPVAPRQDLSVLLESGGVSIVFKSRFLSPMKTRGTRHYPCEAGTYPTPQHLASAVALALNDLKAARAQVTLVIPKAWAIVKTAEFPLTIKENLPAAISHELDRLTPLSPERAFYDFRILTEDENRLRIMLVAMKADTLQPYVEALRGKGITLRRVTADDEGMNLLDKGVHKSPKTPMALTIVLLSVLVALGLFWLLSPLQIEEKRIEAIDREIAGRKDEVKKIEALKNDLDGLEKETAAIHAFKDSRPMMLNLLREMTRVLPKNTWLSRIRCTESTVEIEGYAASATEILPKLEASVLFKKVEFSSATFRDARLKADRFNIKMEIEGLPEEKAIEKKK